MDFEADLDIFFADSDHTATVAGEDLPTLYDAPFTAPSVYTQQVESSAPACTLKSADALRLEILHGTPVTIKKNGVPVGDFTVNGIQPDGAGLTRLILTNVYED